MQRKRIPLLITLFVGVACSGSKPDTAAPDPAPPVEPELDAPFVDAIPAGWFEVTPQIAVPDVDAATDFYGNAFGASRMDAIPGPDGKTVHAEIKIGDSLIMVDAESEGLKSPKTLGGTPVSLMLYVHNADEAYAAAIGAGAKAVTPLEEQFWGDKFGKVVDPYGHEWGVASRVVDLTDEQVKERAALFGADMASAGAAKDSKDKKAKKEKKEKKAKKKSAKKAEPSWKKVEGKPAASAVPAGYHTVTMAITVPDAKKVLGFYSSVFGAKEKDRLDMPDGKIMHVEIRIGSSAVMFSDENPAFGSKSAVTLGGSPVILHHYTEDADAVFKKATEAGAKIAYPLEDAPWGDRYGAVIDAAGLPWGIATHKEDLTSEEIAERVQAKMAEHAGAKPDKPPAAK